MNQFDCSNKSTKDLLNTAMKTVEKKAVDVLITTVVAAAVFLNSAQAENPPISSQKSNYLKRTIKLDSFNYPAFVSQRISQGITSKNPSGTTEGYAIYFGKGLFGVTFDTEYL